MPRAGLSYRGKAPSSYNLSVSLRSTRPGCGSQRLLRCRSHPAGRCPNSSSLFPPLAAVVAVAPGRGASGETVHFAGTAKASPTRGGGSASALTERLYKDGPALGSSLVNLPPRLSPQNAKPPRSRYLQGGFSFSWAYGHRCTGQATCNGDDRGQQDASGSEADAGSRNPGSF